MVYSVLPDSPVIHLLHFLQRKHTKNVVPETYHSPEDEASLSF